MNNEIPMLGVLPDSAMPPEPGETVDAPPMHYRNRETRSPLCGAEASDETPYARKWDDVTCNECVTLKPERGRKAKPTKADEKKTVKPPQPGKESEALAMMLGQACNVALFHNRLPPAPPQALAPWTQSVVMAMDHYGLLQAASHPLGAVAVTSAMLYMAMRDFEPLVDDAALFAAHGIKP